MTFALKKGFSAALFFIFFALQARYHERSIGHEYAAGQNEDNPVARVGVGKHEIDGHGEKERGPRFDAQQPLYADIAAVVYGHNAAHKVDEGARAEDILIVNFVGTGEKRYENAAQNEQKAYAAEN